MRNGLLVLTLITSILVEMCSKHNEVYPKIIMLQQAPLCRVQ